MSDLIVSDLIVFSRSRAQTIIKISLPDASPGLLRAAPRLVDGVVRTGSHYCICQYTGLTVPVPSLPFPVFLLLFSSPVYDSMNKHYRIGPLHVKGDNVVYCYHKSGDHA